MGVYKYDAINDVLIPIAGVPSVPGIEDKVSTYTADATYWDTSPTSASNKPVTSGGVYTALSNKADASALSDKLNTYASDSTQWDVTPTAASNNPVTSSGISAALSGKAPITHTSSTPDTYGAGTTSLYGHNKIVDGLTKTSVASGESLSAHMGNCIGNMIAPVQANLIAIQKYEIGEQFIYDGVLYTATSLISKDGTISINGNCSKASDIVSQISNLANRYGITATRSAVNLAICDGISNLDAYLNTARNSITNWLNNLDSNTYVHFDRLRIGSINIINESAILLPKGGGYATAGASNFVVSFIFNGKLCVYEAVNFAHFYELNGSTFTDHGSEIPANGTVIAVDVTYYKKGI